MESQNDDIPRLVPQERKRGKLSREEEFLIKQHATKLTIQQLAELLNRTTEPIRRYITENDIQCVEMTQDEVDVLTLKSRLHTRPYWLEVMRQLEADKDELAYFEALWIELMKQFQEDVTVSEEIQIKQWIVLEILMNRSMKERKRHIADVDRLQKAVDAEYDKKEDKRDLSRLANLEQQLSYSKNSISSYTNEHMKLLKEVGQISKDLKANRSERLKRIEDGKTSWVSLIKMFEDTEVQRKEGRTMELMKMAANKAKLEMSQLHTFIDGSVDRPFLTPESVALEDEDEDNTQEQESKESQDNESNLEQAEE